MSTYPLVKKCNNSVIFLTYVIFSILFRALIYIVLYSLLSIYNLIYPIIYPFFIGAITFLFNLISYDISSFSFNKILYFVSILGLIQSHSTPVDLS